MSNLGASSRPLMVRCRPETVTNTAFLTVPGLHCNMTKKSVMLQCARDTHVICRSYFWTGPYCRSPRRVSLRERRARSCGADMVPTGARNLFEKEKGPTALLGPGAT